MLPAAFNFCPTLRQVGLTGNLLIQAVTKHHEEHGTQQVVDDYFDTFVQLTNFNSGKNSLALQNKPKIILGIDPGTVIMGFGLITVEQKNMQLLEMGILKLSTKMDAYERLQLIHEKVASLITYHRPTCFAIEAPFFGKNVQSMLKLGRAQGVAIAAAMQAGISVTEYSPKKVKQSITGNGNASKEQVMKMLQRMLNIQEENPYYDASDALSVAVCHHFQDNPILQSTGKKIKDWSDFINRNPSRVNK